MHGICHVQSHFSLRSRYTVLGRLRFNICSGRFISSSPGHELPLRPRPPLLPGHKPGNRHRQPVGFVNGDFGEAGLSFLLVWRWESTDHCCPSSASASFVSSTAPATRMAKRSLLPMAQQAPFRWLDGMAFRRSRRRLRQARTLPSALG